jgi:hypothetical protein
MANVTNDFCIGDHSVDANYRYKSAATEFDRMKITCIDTLVNRAAANANGLSGVMDR